MSTIFDYSKNNIFNDASLYIQNDHVVFFLVHNFTDDTFSKLLEIENKIVAIFYIGDYFTFNMLDELLCQSKNYYDQFNKLKSYYVILSVHDIIPTIKNEYKDFFTHIFEPNLYAYFNKIFDNRDINFTFKEKHFLSLNGRSDFFRQSLYYFFIKFSLLEKGYFSYIGDSARAKLNIYQINDLIENETPWYAKNLPYKEILKSIPYEIPNHNYADHYNNGESFLYEKTLVSIQIETYSTENFPYFTEKIFRIIANKHPFILQGASGSLEFLRDMGFKTFDNWWDESYDCLSDHNRLEAIFHLILEIANWPITKINKISTEMIPVLEHNANHFKNVLPKKFEVSKDNIYSRIKDIAKEKEKFLK
jgi:hypothetical protein